MPRPTTKDDLMAAATAGYRKLMALVDAIPADRLESEFVFDDRDRNVRDVLAHLTAWHGMMRRWYSEGMAGAKPDMPAAGYTWRGVPALNHVIWQDAQEVSVDQVRARLDASHADMVNLIGAHTDSELFTKKLYPWTGSTSLGSYLVSATSSHYDWAQKKLRRAQETW
ncbi:MAG: ClbS/DfsB family four-helix bundle protein [Bifidobacteriaceae bacterium]|jgi:hypothetical protein|nr:ClbS/DfsB family four-helix bundle protein [Bifidobacteriaceae bacterium]